MGKSRNRFVPLANLSNKQTNIESTSGHAADRSVPYTGQRRRKPTYSEAVTSSQASFPPLVAPAIESMRPGNASANMRGGKMSSARGARGHPRGSRADYRENRGSFRGSPSRNTSFISTSARPDNTGSRLDMNEDLTERFGRGNAFRQSNTPPPPSRPPMVVNQSIRQYVKTFDRPVNLLHWTGYRDIPSAEEIFDSGNRNLKEDVLVPDNTVVGPYESREDYLERHYALLREDAVAPLRSVVSEVQEYPLLEERESDCNANIYEKVFITGLTLANSGIAARLTFSLRRVGKKVNWEQSKRLLTGTIVALTPANDMFRSTCHVAVIAARPLAGLEQNPPEIDIFFGAPDEIEIDPQQEWLMVESRNGFYEGYRHTLQSLQMLAKEEFPLSEHIVDIVRDVRPPAYVEARPQKDLSTLFQSGGKDVLNVDILAEWPNHLPNQLDVSQMEALRRIIAKRLAIVQGPPGTGKAHVSVIAIKLLLENMAVEDPPILVAAHTNHALDQLLRHIAVFEPRFIRLGGWTKDLETIKPRTLYEVKSATRNSNPVGSLRLPALTKIKQLTRDIRSLLAPLTEGDELLSAAVLYEYGVISDVQCESLVRGAKEWVRAGAADKVPGEIAIWLGDERIEAKQRTLPEDFGIEIEEADLEFEQLKELEAESKLVDEEDHDTLRGPRIVFSEPYTGHKTIGVTEEAVQDELKKQNLWDISPEFRGPAYRYMQKSVKDAIRTKLRAIAHGYSKASQEAKIGGWELDYNFLKEARVIGMTTTGLSKYRGLLQALDPRVVIIEEAAETLEAPIAVACFKTLEHLILVGDHQQLRAHCNEEELAGNPYYLGVSMFERLVRNKVEFTQLKRQRRMIPEIRRALGPIYEDLEDHPSVLDRLPVPGMGGVNTYFFTHKWRETKDTQMSTMNVGEADLIVCFFKYLVQNGMEPSQITILTFYNGQRKLILRKLRENRLIPDFYYKVVTVDSYQGEENAIVLLSLVRSNEDGKIGFLEVENRVCVALSRAQRGFYMFGDAPNLCMSSMLWWHVVGIMGRKPSRVGFYLPLTCQNHQQTTFIKEPYDMLGLDGGCTRSCQELLGCGHTCALNCHPFPHNQVACQKHCSRLLECGHPCTQLCNAECKSDCICCAVDELDTPVKAITLSPKKKLGRSESSPSTKQKQPRTSSQHDRLALEDLHELCRNSAPASQDLHQNIGPFRDYAAGGHVDSDNSFAMIAENESLEARQKRLDDETFAALFGETDAPGLAKSKDNVSLVRTKQDGEGGTRGIWKGTFEVPQANSIRPKDEMSLLDLL